MNRVRKLPLVWCLLGDVPECCVTTVGGVPVIYTAHLLVMILQLVLPAVILTPYHQLLQFNISTSDLGCYQDPLDLFEDHQYQLLYSSVFSASFWFGDPCVVTSAVTKYSLVFRFGIFTREPLCVFGSSFTFTTLVSLVYWMEKPLLTESFKLT